MKEINIAKTIISKRREKGLTQDDLASYIGVSKASVSKWETGQSYPDITFLPQLAAFFNISIDELIGYEPQMDKADIRKLYLELSTDFTIKPFDEVVGHCHEVSKKYFSCFPLLFQIGALLVNNSMQSGDTDKSFSVIAQAKELFLRVKNESKDAQLCQLALNMEAFCALTLSNADEVIELLEGTSNMIVSTETLLAPAYQMLGKLKKAKSVLQVGLYQHMGLLLGALTHYLPFCTDEPIRFEETYRRALAIANAFDLENLHPSVLVKLYIVAAHGYTVLKNTNKALEVLEEYTRLVTGDIYPLKLKGDGHFDLIDEWIEQLDLGAALPRNEKIVRQSMVESIVNNPAFNALAEERRFQRIAEKLKNELLGGAI